MHKRSDVFIINFEQISRPLSVVLIVDFQKYFLLAANTVIFENFYIEYVLHIFEYFK